MMTTREKMEQAKSLIQQKRYDEARSVLRTVNHPLAQEWLGKIDKLDPPEAPWDILPPLEVSTPSREPDYSVFALIVLVLFFVAWLPGVIANLVILTKANRDEKAAGHRLPGVGLLRAEKYIFFYVPIILLGLFMCYVIFLAPHVNPSR
jgi:hypothetical protein